jgi:hypothetical protein
MKFIIFPSLLFTLFLTVNSLTAECQITKGNWLVGGTGKFYSYTSQYTSATYSNEAKYTQIDLSPNIGLFIVDKLAFGIRPSFTSIKGEVTTDGGLSTNTQRYWIGPFGRYYFLPPDKQFNILTDISYQHGFFGGIPEGKLNQFSLMAGPVIYFNSSVGIEFLLGYSSSLEDVEGFQKETRKGFQVGIGFQIHLEK